MDEAPDVPTPQTHGDRPLTVHVMRRLLRQQIYFAVLIGAVIWFLFEAHHVIPLFIFSFILAYILSPVVSALTRGANRRYGASRTGAILTVYAALVLILAGVGWLATGKIVTEVHNLTSNYPALRAELIRRVHESEKTFPLDRLSPSMRDSLDNTINNLDKRVGDAVHALTPLAVHEVPGLLELLVIPILAYYLLKDGGEFIRVPRNFVREEQRARYDVLIRDINESLRGYLKGQTILSAVAAVLVFMILTAFRVHYAYLVAIAAFFLELIPVVGPLVWAAIAVLLTYIQYPNSAIFVLILVTLAHQFDMHILAPKILGGHLRLHPAVVIVALVSGNAVFGLLGALLAAPVAALLSITVRYLVMEGALSSQAVMPEPPATSYTPRGPMGRAARSLTGRLSRDRVITPADTGRGDLPKSG
jgi:predicted PurR-regulated permease PerM